MVETTRSGSAPTSSSLLGSTDATATARSPSCCAEQWLIYDKRVEWIWRREGLKVPRKQPKRGRLSREGELAPCRRVIREPTSSDRVDKTQVDVVHLRQLGVCMLWRRRYLSVSQVNCLRD